MNKQTTSSITKRYIYILVGVLLLGIVSQIFYKRFDLTQDRRYTLSEITVQMLDTISSPIEIEVLLSGKSTSEFRRLQQETHQILEEFSSINRNIKNRFIDHTELTVSADSHDKKRSGKIQQIQHKHNKDR